MEINNDFEVKQSNYIFIFTAVLLLAQCKPKAEIEEAVTLSKEEIGKMIFFDKTLSNPTGQSCASCHDPKTGFSDPNHAVVSPGAVAGIFGNRNAPSISYAMYTPALYFDKVEATHIGGIFWDGRVNTLHEQIKRTLFNPLEMNNKTLEDFVKKVEKAQFYSSLKAFYGATYDPEKLMNNLVDAIVAYEKSEEVNPFSSKFDYYQQGKVKLTPLELEGMQLFKDENKAKCANCHLIEKDKQSGKILFTDFTYDNIGVPKNKQNPFYQMPNHFNFAGKNYIDYGLKEATKSPENSGQFKVPTLRNIANTAPYFHNGVFNNLEDVLHFYNKRDVDPHIGPPEINKNVNTEELGDLKLSKHEEKAIIAFLKTLTDGFKIEQ